MLMLNLSASYRMKMTRMKIKTYNQLIFDSFKKDRRKGSESNVKLNRIKKKLWRGRGKLSIK